MEKPSLYKKFLLPGILLFFLILFNGCAGNNSKPTSPVSIDLQFKELPALNQEVSLEISISSLISLEDVHAKIILPPELALVSGETEWKFDLEPGQINKTEILLLANQLGETQIQVEATGQQGISISGNKKIIYINVQTDTASISTEPFSQVPTSGPDVTSSTPKMEAPVQIDLYPASELKLGEAFTLLSKAITQQSADVCDLKLLVPENVQIISGATTWSGSVVEGQEISLTNSLMISAAGDYTFVADILCSTEDFTFGRQKIFKVTATDTEINTLNILETQNASPDLPSQDLGGWRQPKPLDSPDTSSSLFKFESDNTTPQNETAPEEPINVQTFGGTVRVYGWFSYLDQNSNSLPVRDARIEIWDVDAGPSYQKLTTVYTDNSGYYSASVSNSDSSGSNGQDIFVKVLTTDDFSVKVTNFSGNIYFADTEVTNDVPDGDYYVGNRVVTDATRRMSYFIYDKIANDAYDYFFDLGWISNYNLQVNWDPNNTSDGTHYHFGGSIDLLGGDRWDEDVILHEYGHFVMYKTYAAYPNSPSCDPHSWGIHSSQGCALTEGWANFIQGAIQGHQDYVDTEDQILHIYMEPPSPAAHHPEDEGAVAASLWDIFDVGSSESWDTLTNGITGIWDVFNNYEPNTIIEFNSDWVSSSNGNDCKVYNILNHLLITVTNPCIPYTLTISKNEAGSGTVTSSPAGINCGSTCSYGFSEGTVVTLTATPAAGFTFTGWVGVCSGTGSCQVTMTAAASITANFTQNPINVQASDGTYTDKVRVSWIASSGATTYNVYRAVNTTDRKSLLGSPTGTAFGDTTATPGLTYYYWVKACNGVNCTVYSTANTGWRNFPAPTGLQGSDGTYTDKVQVSWNPISGATTYNVYRATSASGTKSLLGSPAGTAFADTTATPGPTYYYFVKACMGANCSGYSTTDTGWRNLSAPANLQASDGTFTDKVRVSWTASSGATSYNVYRATSATTTKSLVGSLAGVTFYDTTATPGVTYTYWVKVCNGASCSVYSISNTGWRNLSTPTNLQASDGTYTDKVRVSWNSSSGATSYKVYRATSGTTTKSLLGSPAGTAFADITATPGLTYTYWVKACRGTLCSVYSTVNTGWRKP
ncbi:MAG: hypothetical protein A2X25_06245 [Chloroflexi bacterium GWB2_49_20]|nr:MAG: hypothetical protein A2X25_06245 [Chloroflexi bacterium GWB2_49_20]OGN80356.1 MAG: hypothetical protein A2X26_08540 [Chloroflexi bacterium GWC2_49_37]OGN85819.1 MAG: hypothetical protein A2X27_03355 [Chloroflexi bacterium GWD2_49_16]